MKRPILVWAIVLMLSLCSTVGTGFGAGTPPSHLTTITFVDFVDGSEQVLFSSDGVGVSVSYAVSPSRGSCYTLWDNYHWDTPTAGYSIDLSYPQQSEPPPGAAAAIGAGFETWNTAGATFRYTPGSGVSTSWTYLPTWNKYAVAQARINVDSQGHITSGMITFNGYFKFAIDGSKDAEDLQSIAVHEAGHTLGLDHTSCSSEVMYGGGLPYGQLKRSLGAGDRAGIAAIYGGSGPSPTATGYSLTVAVTDKAGRRISGASVSLDDVLQGTTDRSGKLIITGVTAGTHTVTVTKRGYKAVTEQVTVNADTTIRIVLRK